MSEEDQANGQDGSADGTENTATSNGSSIAALPAPETPDTLTPELTASREPVAAELGPEQAADSQVATQTEQAAEGNGADTPADNVAASEAPEQDKDKDEAKVGA